MDLGLKGKVAMVAGASRGLGYAVARALAAEGVQGVDRLAQRGDRDARPRKTSRPRRTSTRSRWPRT